MSTWREIVITDHRGRRLSVTINGEGVIKADCLDGDPVDIDEVDRQRLRDFLAAS